MDIIVLEESPSQSFPLGLSGVNHIFQFMYNQIANRWSCTIFKEGEKCPIIAGRFIEEGVNILEEINKEQVLLVVGSNGFEKTEDQFRRYTKQREAGYTDTFLVFGDVQEFRDLIDGNNVQSFCGG